MGYKRVSGGVERGSLDKAHKESMKVLEELVKTQKESNRNDLIVLAVNVVVTVLISFLFRIA